jgi:hypothetical protein
MTFDDRIAYVNCSQMLYMVIVIDFGKVWESVHEPDKVCLKPTKYAYVCQNELQAVQLWESELKPVKVWERAVA